MLILTKSALALMIGFLISIIIAVLFIPVLRKFKLGQNLSIYLEKNHSQKKGTPTMGGIIFLISTMLTIVLFLIFKKIELTNNLLIIIFTFLGYGIIGLMDDILIIIKKNNKGLSPSKKMLFQLIISIIFFYLFMKSGNEPLIWIHTLGIKLHIGWIYGLFILLILVASSNAVNITDGLDGLAAGLSLIAFLTFGIITWNTGWLLGYEDIAIFCFVLVGSIFGFLIFNVYPAKIFMGDTGSLSLGATLGALAILTRHEVLLLVIGSVFVIETITCILQIIYFKLTKKRLFPITPIHHSFERMNWHERDIVKLFWIIGLISSLLAIVFGVWL